MTDETTPLPPGGDASPSDGDRPAGHTPAEGAAADRTPDDAPAPGGSVATQAPPEPAAPASPPFVRSSRDRVLGGVAGAIAARLDVDPTLVRVVFVVLAILSGGVAVPAYLLTWAVVARDDDPAPRVYQYVAIREGGALMWIIAVVLAVSLVDGLIDPFDAFDGAPLLPLLLVGIGIALWTRGDRPGRRSGLPPRGAAGPPAASASPPPSPGDATTTWAAASTPSTTDPSTTGRTTVPLDTTTRPTPPADADGGWPPAGPRPVTTPPPPRAPRPPRERSALGAVTIALALIAAGVAAALDASSALAIDLGATGVAAIALLTIGLGLLVGSVWGRARWLLLVALLMMPFIGLGVLVRAAEDQLGVDVDVSSGVGERRVDLIGSQPLPDELELLAGSIDVDLSAWQPVGEDLDDLDGDVDLRIQLGAGEVDIEMPAGVAWRVTSELGLGEYRVRGDGVRTTETVEETFPLRDGEEFGSTFVREGGPDDGPVLDVQVDVGVGQITIRETTPTTGDTAGTDDEELS